MAVLGIEARVVSLYLSSPKDYTQYGPAVVFKVDWPLPESIQDEPFAYGKDIFRYLLMFLFHPFKKVHFCGYFILT